MGAFAPTASPGADLNNSGDVLANFRFNCFSFRLRCGFFPCACLLLSDSPFARSRFGLWLFRCGRLPLSRFFASLAQLLLVQIPSKLLIRKPAPEPRSSDCQSTSHLDPPSARAH